MGKKRNNLQINSIFQCHVCSFQKQKQANSVKNTSSWGNLSPLFFGLIGHLSTRHVRVFSTLFTYLSVYEANGGKYKSTNRTELSSISLVDYSFLPEQKWCIPCRLRSQRSSRLDGNLNNCSIMRQIHLDSSWWRTGSLIGRMQLSETFLCLMIYPQAVWALVGKIQFYCAFMDNNSYCRI